MIFRRKKQLGDLLFEDDPWQEVSPEEWAARNWLRIHSISTDGLEFSNKKLQRWVLRLEEILKNPEQLKLYRDQYLSESEKVEEKRLIEKVRKNGL